MFAAFRRKIINSVFLTFKESLLAFNHCDKLLRSWLSFLAKTSSDQKITNQKITESVLNLILGALFGGVHPKIC